METCRGEKRNVGGSVGKGEGREEKGAGVDLKCSVNEVCYLVLRACRGRGQGEDKGSLGKSAGGGLRCGDAKVDS